jgi:hypothetical protein
MKTALQMTLALTGATVASGAIAESLQLGPLTQWDGGRAEVAMIEMDGPVVVGSIGEDGILSIDLPAPEGDDGRPLAAVFGCGGVGRGQRECSRGNVQRLGVVAGADGR